MSWQKTLKKRETKEDMSFIEHLEELRWNIIRSILAVLIGGIVIFVFRNEIFDYFILGPLHKDFLSYKWMCQLGQWLNATEYLCVNNGINMSLQSTKITAIFNTTIKLSLVGGLMIAFPYIIWEVWKFIKPALKNAEIKGSKFFVFWISFFFFMGVFFGYFIIAPFSINFLFNFNLGTLGIIDIKPTVSDYMENFTTTVLGVAIAFELPVVIYILTKLSIINASQLVRFRKYAIVFILFIAAIITPSPDWISQMVVALPLLMLYEISILIARYLQKKKRKNEIWE